MRVLLLACSIVTLSLGAFTVSNPAKCAFTEGNYHLEWVFEGGPSSPTKEGSPSKNVGKGGVVHFRLEVKNFPVNENVWTGVAFGQSMKAGLDAIIVKSVGGQLSVSDESVKGYGPSHPDPNQDGLSVELVRINDGNLQAHFSRPAWASEPAFDKDLNGCTSWHFVSSLGNAHPDHVGKHFKTPSGRKVCLDECGTQ